MHSNFDFLYLVRKVQKCDELETDRFHYLQLESVLQNVWHGATNFRTATVTSE